MDNFILKNLESQKLTNTSKFLFLLLNSEEKDRDGFFYLSQREFSERLSISRRQLIKYLNDLAKKHLIEKDLRSVAVAGDRARRRLFIKTRSLETEKNMTFFATFSNISADQKTAYLKDIHNVIHDINFTELAIDLELKDENLKALKDIKDGTLIMFNACVLRVESRTIIKNIHNIKNRCEYYDC